MKKWICMLLCVLLLSASCACGVSALIAVEDENGIRYSTDETETTTQPSAISAAAKKAMESVSNFWHRFGAVTVIILLLVAIVVAIVISEVERQKKEKRSQKPTPKKKKKKK